MSKHKPRKAVAMTASAPQKMEEFTIGEPVPLTTGKSRLNGIKKPTFLVSVLWLNACISFAMK
ncbi:hypothetical protein QWY69_005870 [Klebsiella aerogenes]|uniref:hypothetical protein n=1 Tax=Klebsiella aerogenes TaxID=548 RepID=UPI0025B43A31|nr:hypothetical protein [Klebsiella aerogenes]MDN3791021.1 hypothetical protein [Klebsiella aerogenes]